MLDYFSLYRGNIELVVPLKSQSKSGLFGYFVIIAYDKQRSWRKGRKLASVNRDVNHMLLLTLDVVNGC